MVTKEQILKALGQVKHPEVEQDLVTLKMIERVAVEEGAVSFSLLLPFKEVPIRDQLVSSAREAVQALDPKLEVKVELAEMDQVQRAAFMAEAEGGPKPAQSVNQVAHTIAVLSGKGGVGKSSVAALLAVALHRQGARVGVLDADITGPSIPKLFGLHEAPKAGPLGILPVESRGGVKVMSINLLLPGEDQAVIWRGPLISGAIKQFWQEVTWGALDYLIVDLPPGTSDASLTVMQSIPLSGVVLVTSPQDLAGMVVRKAARMAQQMKVPILGLIENMSGIVCPHCGKEIEVFGPSKGWRTAAQLGLPLLGQLPLDPELAVRCDAGEIEDYAGALFEPVAQKVMDRVPGSKTTPIF